MTPAPQRQPARTDARTAALAALVALALILIWIPLTVHCNYGGNWSALFCTGAALKVPPALAATTYTFPNSYGYDGEFYRYVAHDPFFRKDYARYIDAPRFRYRRALVPLLAWMLALGQPGWIDAAFIVVVVGSVLAGVYWCAGYMAWRGYHPAWSLLFLILPATVTSIDRMLTDVTLAALFAGYLYYASSHHWRGAYAVSALAVLTRETGLILVVGLVAFWILRRCGKRAVLCATAVLPALLWYAFVNIHTAPVTVSGAIDLPLAAWLWSIGQARPDPNPWVERILHAASLVGLAGLLASTALAVRWAWKRAPGPVEIAVLLFAAMSVVLGPAIMSDPYAYGRAVSPLLLFVMLEAAGARVWAALVPPAGVCAAVGVMLGAQVVGVAKVLLRL